MERLGNYLFFGFVLLIIFYHLFTLEIQPLPWFDEVYFASIADNFITNGSLVPEIASSARNGRPALTYGPVYFFLTGLCMKVFGFGIAQFRIVAMISGLLCVRLTYLIWKITGPSEPWKFKVLLLALLMDPFFSLTFHQGRMDLTALCFALIAIFYYLKGKKSGKSAILVSGLAGVLALLTTPRIAVVLWPLVVFVVLDSITSKEYQNAGIWVAPFLFLYPVWIVMGFGGIGNFVHYYQTIREATNAANSGYVGPNFYIPPHEYCLIFIAIIALVYGAIKQGKGYFNRLTILSLLVMASFYLIVFDWGPYSSLIIPFYYILIFNSWALVPVSKGWKTLYSVPVFLLLVFNMGYSFVKAEQVLRSKKIRDPEVANTFVRENIPPGSKVVGDGLYYYAVKKNACDFQLFDQYDTLESRERKHRVDYDYDFLITADVMKPKNAGISNYYIQKGQLEKVAIFRAQSVANGMSDILSDLEKAGYSGSIYRRK